MNKKAFISYSMKDSQQYVLSLLSNLLREQGFNVDSSYDSIMPGDSILQTLNRRISDSDLFIGIITTAGRNNHVLSEWQTAQRLKVPAILLVEDIIPMNQIMDRQVNVVRFNALEPQEALKKAENQIRRAKATGVNQDTDNIFGWVLGGLAVLALIKLLSDD